MARDFEEVFCPFCGANLGRGFFMEDCVVCDEQINDSRYFYDEDCDCIDECNCDDDW